MTHQSSLFSLILAALAAVPAGITGLGLAKTIVMDSLTQCVEEPNLPLTLHDVTVIQEDRNTYVMNGLIKFSSVIKSPWTMNILIEKCQSAQNPDSCEVCFAYKVPDLCPKLGEEDQMWSSFIERTNMTKTCPIQPKEYKIDHVPVDATFLNYVPINQAYLKLYIHSTSGKDKVACIISEVQIYAGKGKGKGLGLGK